MTNGLFQILGAKGSGNFGHSGRPGKKGGSGTGKGKGKKTTKAPVDKEYRALKSKADKATKIAEAESENAMQSRLYSRSAAMFHSDAYSAHKKAYDRVAGKETPADMKKRRYHATKMQYHRSQESSFTQRAYRINNRRKL